MDFVGMRNCMPTSSTDASLAGGPFSDNEGIPTTSYENGVSVSSGRRTSRVWRYFRMVDNCHYVCCLCSFVGAYTNTTNMRKHIQNHHPEIFQDILDHTRPTHRLHYLNMRPLQSHLFQNQYQQPYLNSNLTVQTLPSNQHGSSSGSGSGSYPCVSIAGLPQYSDVEQISDSNGAGEEGESSGSDPQSLLYPSKESFWEKPVEEETEKFSMAKDANYLIKPESKSYVSGFCLGDDRKVEVGGFTGLSESSAGSGDNQGACDEISIPLSPEQFMSEETEQGASSPHTPQPQRPESYKLRHNNHLNLVLESLAGDESFMDVTLTAQGKAIKAHKSVLSAVSPYFRSVLRENPCQHPIIIMPRDIRYEELNSIISYVYRGEMTVAAEDLSSLLKTAEILQVTGLSPSDSSGGGTGGIMSQMQGLPPGILGNTSSKKFSKQKHHAHILQQQQNQPQPHQHTQHDEDDDDESMTDDPSDPQGRIDPLEFLNADMTCVKEEIQSDNDEGAANTPIPMSVSGSNEVSELCTTISDSPNTSPDRRKSASGSPKPVEDLTSKPFNPGELGGSSSADENLSPSSPLPFTCPHCFEVHRPQELLQTHLRLKHPSKPSFACACGKVFGRVSHLAEHSKRCKITP